MGHATIRDLVNHIELNAKNYVNPSLKRKKTIISFQPIWTISHKYEIFLEDGISWFLKMKFCRPSKQLELLIKISGNKFINLYWIKISKKFSRKLISIYWTEELHKVYDRHEFWINVIEINASWRRTITFALELTWYVERRPGNKGQPIFKKIYKKWKTEILDDFI